MRRNCNLELRLVPPSAALHSCDYKKHFHPMTKMEDANSREKEQQQLTIFYNGKVVVCDVTELQARAIILLASREMEEKSSARTPPGSDPISPLLQSPLYSPTGLSMKKSLQRFLQKRRNRLEATSPYYHH